MSADALKDLDRLKALAKELADDCLNTVYRCHSNPAHTVERLHEQARAVLALIARVEQAEAERDGWLKTARHMAEGMEFYRGIVTQCGEPFGVEARTSDDGSVQDSVLALKVPELVQRATAELAALKAERTCATCRYQVKADRNCQLVLLAAGVEMRTAEKMGIDLFRQSVALPRPGDDQFRCAFHEPTPPTGAER